MKIDQIEVWCQVVAQEVVEETRQVLLEENLKGSKVLQHLWVQEGFSTTHKLPSTNNVSLKLCTSSWSTLKKAI